MPLFKLNIHGNYSSKINIISEISCEMLDINFLYRNKHYSKVSLIYERILMGKISALIIY